MSNGVGEWEMGHTCCGLVRDNSQGRGYQFEIQMCRCLSEEERKRKQVQSALDLTLSNLPTKLIYKFLYLRIDYL